MNFLCTEPGKVAPSTLPKKLLDFDICYESQGEEHFTGVLILKDDYSGYIWLEPYNEEDAAKTAGSLIRWFRRFRPVSFLVFGQRKGIFVRFASLHLGLLSVVKRESRGLKTKSSTGLL